MPPKKQRSTRSPGETKRRMAHVAATGGEVVVDDTVWEPPPDLSVFIRNTHPHDIRVVAGVDEAAWHKRGDEPWVQRFADDEIPVDVFMRLARVDDRYVCTAILVEGLNGTELSSRQLRGVRFATVLADFRDQYGWPPLDRAPQVQPARQGAAPIDDAFLREVAARRRGRRAMGSSTPIKDLAEYYGRTEATIHRWLQRAEDKGILNRKGDK